MADGFHNVISCCVKKRCVQPDKDELKSFFLFSFLFVFSCLLFLLLLLNRSSVCPMCA